MGVRKNESDMEGILQGEESIQGQVQRMEEASWVRNTSWVDLRIMNVQEGKNQHTRHGVRLTVEQVKELIPRLVEFCAAYDDEIESAERSDSSTEV